MELHDRPELICISIPFILSIIMIGLGLILYARWNRGSLEKQGFTVIPSEHFLLGSALLTYRKPGGIVDIENMRKYGSCYGIYEGREPQIIISDADLIRKIAIKDADHFDSKRPLDFGDPLLNEFVKVQEKSKWKAMRSMLSPVLSSVARLKSSNPVMREAIYDFISGVKGKCIESGGRLEMFCATDAIFSMLTDLMVRSFYSIDLGKSGYGERFNKLVRMLTQPPANEAHWIAKYAYAFPFMTRFLPNPLMNPEPSKEFQAILKQLISTRKQERINGQGPPQMDYLDSLVEWYGKLETEEYRNAGITEMTILSQGLLLFIGGQDQISFVLGAMLKHISENPEIEKRLHEEVDDVFEKNGGVLQHESLSELRYLTACVMEAARLYPFFSRAERVCTKDWRDEERGIQVKKGNVVLIALWALHRNPEYFEDGDEFKPERFLPGKREQIHPYANCTFGFGPRNCVGQRLAMEVMVLVAVHLVKELRFKKRNDTMLSFVPTGPFVAACEPIYFDVEVRK